LIRKVLGQQILHLMSWTVEQSSKSPTEGGLYLQALRCLSQWSEQVQKKWEYRMRIEYLILQWRRIFIDPQRWAKVPLMGCAQQPNRRDCQDFSVVGARNRHLVLILVMSCPASHGEVVELIWNVPWIIGTRGSYGGVSIPGRGAHQLLSRSSKLHMSSRSSKLLMTSRSSKLHMSSRSSKLLMSSRSYKPPM
jgi:hypothetical protein